MFKCLRLIYPFQFIWVKVPIVFANREERVQAVEGAQSCFKLTLSIVVDRDRDGQRQVESARETGEILYGIYK